MARQWTQHILDSKRKSRVLDHCLQAEPVKLQGEFQGLAPARPSIRVQAVAGQTVLSRHRVEIANQSQINHIRYFPRFDQVINSKKSTDRNRLNSSRKRSNRNREFTANSLGIFETGSTLVSPLFGNEKKLLIN